MCVVRFAAFSIVARVAGVAFVALATATPVLAQSATTHTTGQASSTAFDDSRQSHWGVTGGFTPEWKTGFEMLEKLFSADRIDMRGGEFHIGVARGRVEGGDWGVSFVRKSIADDSVVFVVNSSSCSTSGGSTECFEDSNTYRFSGASLYGVQAHKHIPFVTIRRRVQVGLVVAGGIAKFGGSTVRTRVRYRPNFDPVQRQPAYVPETDTETVDIDRLLEDEGAPPVLPVGKIELAGTVILPAGLKLRVGGGFNFPGFQKFSASIVYLFGVPQ